MTETVPTLSTGPDPVDYQRALPISLDGAGLLRFALILWSSFVLMRHGSYWLRPLLHGELLAQFHEEPRPLVVAIIEGTVLTIVLVMTMAERRLSRRTLASLAWLSATFIAVNLLSFLVEFVRVPDLGLRGIWSLVSRLQLLVVPIVTVTASCRRSFWTSPDHAS